MTFQVLPGPVPHTYLIVSAPENTVRLETRGKYYRGRKYWKPFNELQRYGVKEIQFPLFIVLVYLNNSPYLFSHVHLWIRSRIMCHLESYIYSLGL